MQSMSLYRRYFDAERQILTVDMKALTTSAKDYDGVQIGDPSNRPPEKPIVMKVFALGKKETFLAFPNVESARHAENDYFWKTRCGFRYVLHDHTGEQELGAQLRAFALVRSN